MNSHYYDSENNILLKNHAVSEYTIVLHDIYE